MAKDDYKSAEYDALVTRGNKMVEGIGAHTKDKKERSALPERLRAPDARKRQIDDLKAKRKDFVAAEKALAKASKAYHAAFKALEQALAQDDEAVRGHYGKASDVLADFGTKKIVPPPGRKGGAAKAGSEKTAKTGS